MHQQTPLGSHPDIPEYKDKVPSLIWLTVIIVPVIIVAFYTRELIATGKVSHLKYGLMLISGSLIPIVDILYNWRGKGRLERILNVSFSVFFIGIGLYHIFKP